MCTERKHVRAIIESKNVIIFFQVNKTLKEINKTNKEIKIAKTKTQKFRYGYRRHAFGFEFLFYYLLFFKHI